MVDSPTPNSEKKKSNLFLKIITVILGCTVAALTGIYIALLIQPRITVIVQPTSENGRETDVSTASEEREGESSFKSELEESTDSLLSLTVTPKPTKKPKPTSTPKPTSIPEVIETAATPLRALDVYDSNPENYQDGATRPTNYDEIIGCFVYYAEGKSKDRGVIYRDDVFGGKLVDNGNNYNIYDLNGRYSKFKGVVFLNAYAKIGNLTYSENVFLEITDYDTGEILYKSKVVDADFKTDNFEFSVAGVDKIKIYINGMNYIRVANCYLYE